MDTKSPQRQVKRVDPANMQPRRMPTTRETTGMSPKALPAPAKRSNDREGDGDFQGESRKRPKLSSTTKKSFESTKADGSPCANDLERQIQDLRAVNRQNKLTIDELNGTVKETKNAELYWKRKAEKAADCIKDSEKEMASMKRFIRELLLENSQVMATEVLEAKKMQAALARQMADLQDAEANAARELVLAKDMQAEAAARDYNCKIAHLNEGDVEMLKTKTRDGGREDNAELTRKATKQNEGEPQSTLGGQNNNLPSPQATPQKRSHLSTPPETPPKICAEMTRRKEPEEQNRRESSETSSDSWEDARESLSPPGSGTPQEPNDMSSDSWEDARESLSPPGAGTPQEPNDISDWRLATTQKPHSHNGESRYMDDTEDDKSTTSEHRERGSVELGADEADYGFNNDESDSGWSLSNENEGSARAASRREERFLQRKAIVGVMIKQAEEGDESSKVSALRYVDSMIDHLGPEGMSSDESDFENGEMILDVHDMPYRRDVTDVMDVLDAEFKDTMESGGSSPPFTPRRFRKLASTKRPPFKGKAKALFDPRWLKSAPPDQKLNMKDDFEWTTVVLRRPEDK